MIKGGWRAACFLLPGIIHDEKIDYIINIFVNQVFLKNIFQKNAIITANMIVIIVAASVKFSVT
jgi:hypothetical protein